MITKLISIEKCLSLSYSAHYTSKLKMAYLVKSTKSSLDECAVCLPSTCCWRLWIGSVQCPIILTSQFAHSVEHDSILIVYVATMAIKYLDQQLVGQKICCLQWYFKLKYSEAINSSLASGRVAPPLKSCNLICGAYATNARPVGHQY